MNAQIVMIIITAFIIAFLAHRLFTNINLAKWEKPALLMIVGGAIGNLIDRVRFGAVVDFLDVHIGTLHWPAFNVADIFISSGLMLYIYGLIFINKKVK
jgi:signal peptidase II